MGLWSLEVGVGAVCLAVRLKRPLESVTQLAVGGSRHAKRQGEAVRPSPTLGASQVPSGQQSP